MKRNLVVLAPLLLWACNYDDSAQQDTAALVPPAGEAVAKSTSSGTQSAPKPPAIYPQPGLSTFPISAPAHIVVFILDDLALEEANFTGIAKKAQQKYTPTIDALAAKSIILDNFHAVSPICTPSRYSLLTGNYPSRAQNVQFQQRLALEGAAVPEFNAQIIASDMTLPKRLQALGYRTGFTGKNHVTQNFYYSSAIPQGASLYDPGVAAQLAADFATNKQVLNRVGFNDVYSIYPGEVTSIPAKELRVHNLDWITNGALQFIDTYASQKFFLVDSLTLPHVPLDAASGWAGDPNATSYGRLTNPLAIMPPRSSLTNRVKAAGFAGQENWLWLDDAISAVLQKLESRNLMNDTLIILMGDHGMTAKGSIYLGGSKTPALVYYQGRTGRLSQLTSMLDWQNTILDMIGAAPAGDGTSFKPLLEGQSVIPRKNLYLELGYARAILSGNYEYIAMRHSPYIVAKSSEVGFKLGEWPRYTGLEALEVRNAKLYPAYFDVDQLYDVTKDPDQRNNLATVATMQPTLQQLQDTMQFYANLTPGKFNVKP